MFNKFLFLVLTALFLIGCTQVVRVSKSVEGEVQNNKLPSVKVDGIPFYMKKKVYNKTSVFAQTWLVATLKIEKEFIDKNGSNNISLDPLIRNIEKEDFSKIVALKKEILEEVDNPKNDEYIKAIMKKFSAINEIPDLSDTKEMLIGHTMSSELIVDPKEKYYLNASMPLFGKGELTQILNADGTLSEATVKRDDTSIASSITSLIPLSDYFKAKLIPDDKGRVKKDYHYRLTLDTKEKGYIYRITKQYENDPKGKKYPTFKDHENHTYSYTREEIGKNSNNASSKKAP